MNLQTTINMLAYGTSEGVKKAWDTRGRASIPVRELQEEGAKGAETGKPQLIEAFHNSTHEQFHYRHKDGTFFAKEATPEFGEHTYHAQLSFQNPLVAQDGVAAAKKLGALKLAKDYEAVLSGVDEHDEPLMGDTSPIWHRLDTRMAKIARRAGYDGLIYFSHDDLNPEQYVALQPSVVTGLRKIGKFDQRSGRVIKES